MGIVNQICILHGWSYGKADSALEKWQPLIKLLENENTKVTFLNIPVLTLATEKVFTLEDYIDWLEKELQKIPGKVILMGHSNGGRISLAFTDKYPQKIDKLILIDSAGIYHNELSIKIKRIVFGTLAKIGKKLTQSDKLKAVLYKLAREGDYLNATPTQRQTMINLISLDLTPILEKIRVKTLIIWGKEDIVTPLTDGQKFHRLLSNSELEIISTGRHSPQFTNTEEVAKIIKQFIT